MSNIQDEVEQAYWQEDALTFINMLSGMSYEEASKQATKDTRNFKSEERKGEE